jgi:hypothetical protein
MVTSFYKIFHEKLEHRTGKNHLPSETQLSKSLFPFPRTIKHSQIRGLWATNGNISLTATSLHRMKSSRRNKNNIPLLKGIFIAISVNNNPVAILARLNVPTPVIVSQF